MQANIMKIATWERLSRPQLSKSRIYLKLANQCLIEPIGVWKLVNTGIMGIHTQVDFEIIDPHDGVTYFLDLVCLPRGQKLKAYTSLGKDRIKLEGNSKKVIVPIHPSRENPWEEPYDQEGDIRILYHIIGNNKDTLEPDEHKEIHLESPLSVDYNSNTYLYVWKIENYEMYARDYQSIQSIP